jgi:hypothetical protein
MGTVVGFGLPHTMTTEAKKLKYMQRNLKAAAKDNTYPIQVFVRMDKKAGEEYKFESCWGREKPGVVCFGGAPMEKSVSGFVRHQVPLLPAHAVTIHKSQGMTATNGIVLFPPKIAKFGLTYVGLSRVTRLADLVLATALRVTHFFCDLENRAKVEAEYERLRRLPEQISSASGGL